MALSTYVLLVSQSPKYQSVSLHGKPFRVPYPFVAIAPNDTRYEVKGTRSVTSSTEIQMVVRLAVPLTISDIFVWNYEVVTATKWQHE